MAVQDVDATTGLPVAIATALTGLGIDLSTADITELAAALDDISVDLDADTIAALVAAHIAAIQPVKIDPTTPGTTDGVTTKSGSVSKAENSLDFAHTVTIADAASLSDAEDLGAGNVLVGLILSSGWTTAAVSFQASSAVDGTYVVLRRADGSEISTGSVAASKYVALGDFLPDLSGVRYIKLQSGTSGSPVAQAGGDIVTLVVRPV